MDRFTTILPEARRGTLLAAVVVLVALAVRPGSASAADPRASAGQSLFQEKCTACHTVGGGKRVGPDLKGVTSRRDHAWLVRWIRTPDKVLADKDPVAVELLAQHNNVPMPPLGLLDSQIESVLAYLQSASEAPSSAPEPLALPPGNSASGRELFTGVVRLKSGGPPCMGCHSVEGIGALGGGALGPDLTGAFGKYGGESGLGPLLSNVQFPTMSPIFRERPLEPQEVADLVAFLQSAAVAKRSPASIAQLGMLSVSGGAVFMLLANVVWRRRTTSVRRRMMAGGR